MDSSRQASAQAAGVRLVSTAIVPATPEDATSIAALHAASWRSTYRGLLPDLFLDEEVDRNRLDLWQRRFELDEGSRPLTLKAMSGGTLTGFACALIDDDAEWGTLLDNLHVRPDATSRGIGKLLLGAVLDRVRDAAVSKRLHLWVLDANTRARRFYEREGGVESGTASVELIPDVHVAEVRYVFDAYVR